MSKNNICFIDPWFQDPKTQRKIPPSARFVMSFKADDNGWCDYAEACFLHRTKRYDELWIARGKHASVDGGSCDVAEDVGFIRKLYGRDVQGLAVRRTSEGTDKDAARGLLEAYFYVITQYVSMRGFIKHGMLVGVDYHRTLDGIEKRRDLFAEAARRQAENTPSALVEAAEELDLCPVPSGTSGHSWYGNCPGTNHRLMISAGSEEFGCGYCRVKGGVEELRAFVAKRREKRG